MREYDAVLEVRNADKSIIRLPRHHAADPLQNPVITAQMRAYLSERTFADYQKTTFDER